MKMTMNLLYTNNRYILTSIKTMIKFIKITMQLCKKTVITKYNLQHFPLYLDCQSNHYEVDLLGKTTFKPIPYSSWIKNNTNKNFIKKESLTDNIILSVPPNNDSKYTINHVFTVHDPLDKKTLPKVEIENIFSQYQKK